MMTTSRVAFVHCPDPAYSEMQNGGLLFMPVWAYTLAAHLPPSYQLALVDTRLNSLDEVEQADVFLLSGINQDYDAIVQARDTLSARFNSAKFAIGGPICWSFDQAGDIERLNMFDMIVIGDGEAFVAGAVELLLSGAPLSERIQRVKGRFAISESRPMHRPLLEKSVKSYYGAVVEVSRGCPFLCEFCDIRILPDNNRPHNKGADLILEEMQSLADMGISNFLFACDNFIGEPRWAEGVLDAIIAWKKETGHNPSIYTWLTINLYKMPRLMKKMRLAGFDVVFIGVESFNSNSLLETAKVQNVAAGLTSALRDIQSYGLFVVGGLIFGFDSDGEDCFEQTLQGILDSALLSGDPSLLTALPGTPLYRRMQMAGRLRPVRYGLGGYKYQTNIRYLLPSEVMVDGFQSFVRKLTDGHYQYRRFKSFFDNLERGNYVPLSGKGYTNSGVAARNIFSNRNARRQLAQRVLLFVSRPSNVYYLVLGLFLAVRRPHITDRWNYFKMWVVLWTTVVLKYSSISERDFDIEGMSSYSDEMVLPEHYDDALEPIPLTKVRAQQRHTVGALRDLLAKRRAS
jgi:radical SAM superfamily enzyme YgiQ (UPF0313 family)